MTRNGEALTRMLGIIGIIPVASNFFRWKMMAGSRSIVVSFTVAALVNLEEYFFGILVVHSPIAIRNSSSLSVTPATDKVIGIDVHFSSVHVPRVSPVRGVVGGFSICSVCSKHVLTRRGLSWLSWAGGSSVEVVFAMVISSLVVLEHRLIGDKSSLTGAAGPRESIGVAPILSTVRTCRKEGATAVSGRGMTWESKNAADNLPSLPPSLTIASPKVGRELSTVACVGLVGFSETKVFTDFDRLNLAPDCGAIDVLVRSCSFFVDARIRGIREDCEGDVGVPDPELDVEPKIKPGLRSVDKELECGIFKDSFGTHGLLEVIVPPVNASLS
jgi:hypothetical protein